MSNIVKIPIAGLDETRWINLPLFSDEYPNGVFFSARTEPVSIDLTLNDEYIKLDFPYDAIRVFFGRREITSIFRKESSQIYIFSLTDLINEGVTFPVEVTVVGYSLNYDSHSPSKLIQRTSSTLLSKVPCWDPARNIHNSLAMVNVDIVADSDPYLINDGVAWSDDRIDHLWLDTSTLGFFPYYEKNRIDNMDTTIDQWGKLADWAEYSLYRWTKSEYMPEEYQERELGIPIQYYYFNGAKLTPKDINIGFFKAEGIVGKYDPEIFESSSQVDVYLNGKYIMSGDFSVVVDQVTQDLNISAGDFINIIRTFNHSGALDEGASLQYDYSIKEEYSQGSLKTYYYFWTKADGVVRKNKTMSMNRIVLELERPSTPFQIINNFQFAQPGRNLPDRFNLITLCNIGSIINSNDYYVQLKINDAIGDKTRSDVRHPEIRFLSDQKQFVYNPLQGQNHSEWKLFRENAQDPIPTPLWTKLVESVAGVDLADMDIGLMVTVPYTKFITFDDINGTNFRYGLGRGQVLADSDRLKETVRNTILFTEKDMGIVDRYDFLSQLSFDTPANSIEQMLNIQLMLPVLVVNEIFFNCLNDAMVANSEFSSIMKTSMLSIYGIKLLEGAV